MKNHILATKFYIPPPRSNLISRPRLLDLLDKGATHKLTLLSAPAGYGKTTLLSEWISQCGYRTCWLSLDARDNDLKRFLNYFIYALQQVKDDLGENVLSTLQSSQPPDTEVLLTRLVTEIDTLSQPFVFVLDDYHLITAPEIQQLLLFFLQYQPQQMHLIISGRVDPPWPLSRLRVQDNIVEIRAHEMRFTTEETIAFLNHRMGLSLSPEDIATLEKQTEGWIAGLQLAAISLEKHPDRHAFVTAFAGDHRYIADFLLDEVLLCQPAHIQTFLLQTSLLDQFCAPLCDAVTQRNDSQAILEELERENLFLVSLDHQRHWFRYHHLFADLLRIRLKHENRDSTANLYQRASSWYEAQQMLSEAVRLALMGDDTERVSKLMEGHLLSIVSTSELSLLNRLLVSLPKGTISRNPWLALAQAWGMAYIWQPESIGPLITQATEALEDFDEFTQDRLKGRILVLQSYIEGSKENRKGSIQLAQDALSYLPNSDSSMRSFAILIIGNAHRFEGNLAGAITFHLDALKLSEAAGDTILSVIILSRLIDIYRTMGQLNRSYKIGIQALEKMNSYQSQTGSQSFILGYLKLRLAGAYYERNDLEMALQCAEVGFDLIKAWGAYDSISLGYFNFAKIFQAFGEYDLANNYLHEFKEMYPWENRIQYKFASAHETEIYLITGNLKRANDWMESCGLSLSDHIQFLNFPLYDVFAQVLTARGELDDAQVLLERLLKLSEQSGATQYKMRTLGRKSLILHKKGDIDAAIGMVERALTLAAPEGYLRTFIDQGDGMAELVYQAFIRNIYPEFCKQILDGFSVTTMVDQASQDLVEPLSNREMEVLRLLVTDLPTPEIADELIVSVSTVRSHIKSIYAKLDVHSRHEAVTKARELRIL